MKLSTRLALIVGCAALGMLILVLIALHTIRSSMLEDRQAQIKQMVSLAGKQAGVYLALEKAGTLTRDEAQRIIEKLPELMDWCAKKFRDKTEVMAEVKEVLASLDSAPEPTRTVIVAEPETVAPATVLPASTAFDKSDYEELF